ncbi:hypothetical protein ACIRRA_45985, partial [Nocardia sp. NPDC101769]|uniref:hypothetical protein n=1 Tax=Nocardia sp. NPDC101769 TaxID=3364333 RepID=UPI003805880A
MYAHSYRLLLSVLASVSVLTGCDAAATPQQATHSTAVPTVTNQTYTPGALTPDILGRAENA